MLRPQLRRLLAPGAGPRLRPTAARRSRWLSADATLQTRSVITAEHKQLVHSQRDALISLQLQLRELGAEPEDLELLSSTISHLDELFLLCIVGEFNAGKSSLINALLGGRHLEDGVTPTTDRVYLLKQAGSSGGSALSAAVSGTGHPPPTTLELPVAWLEDVTLVDTPGTNAIVEGHNEITEAIIPRCDLLLFVTSVDRPISESERVFMSKISDWGKKVVVVVNKADMLLPSHGADPEDLSKVLEFVRTASSEALGMQREKVEVFPVSARGALLAKEAEARGEGGFISPGASAGFAALESFILRTLSGPERLKMKLETPMQVASLLVSKYEKTLESRLALVEADAAVIRRIESDLESYSLDMRRDFTLQKAQVENVLLQMAGRGDLFFEDEFVLTNILTLMQTGALRVAFQERVLADTTGQLDGRVRELVDWMVGKTQRQAGSVLDFIHAHTRAAAQEQLVGAVGRTFESNRSTLVETLQRDAQGVVLAYDGKAQTKKLTQSVQLAVGLMVGSTAGAAATVGTVVATSLLDPSFIAFAGVLGAMPILILFRSNIATLSDELDGALSKHLEAELLRSVEDIKTSYSPFDRFVRSEQRSIAGQKDGLQKTLGGLRAALGEVL